MVQLRLALLNTPGVSSHSISCSLQPYVEWLFKGTSSGNFKFKGDSACPPPKNADFTLALKKHTGQLAAMVASLKGWTLKLVRKGYAKEGNVGYVARYRYKKRDFMARLEKVRKEAGALDLTSFRSVGQLMGREALAEVRARF